MVQELLVGEVPGRLGVAGHELANVGTWCDAHTSAGPRRPQLRGALRCAPPVYRSVRGAQVEVGWLCLPLHMGNALYRPMSCSVQPCESTAVRTSSDISASTFLHSLEASLLWEEISSAEVCLCSLQVQ